MLDWIYDTLGVSIEFNSDWTNPYPFRVIEVSSQHDDDFGQWELTLAILGLSLDFVWVYDEGTEARQVVKERFATIRGCPAQWSRCHGTAIRT